MLGWPTGDRQVVVVIVRFDAGNARIVTNEAYSVTFVLHMCDICVKHVLQMCDICVKHV
jgi:hypothetical protein